MRRGVVSAVAIIVVAACGGNGSEPSIPATTSSAEPPATTAQEIPPAETAMAPGEYTFSEFEPTMTFRVGRGWQTGHQRAEFFDVWNGTDALVGWARPEFMIGRTGRRVATAEMTAAAAIEAIAANPAVFGSGRPRDVAIGGVSGMSLEFRTRPGSELFGGAEGAFATAPRSARFRISAVAPSGQLVLVLQISLEPSHDENFRLTETVARSVEFTR